MTHTTDPRSTGGGRSSDVGCSWLFVQRTNHPASFYSAPLRLRDRAFAQCAKFSLDHKLAAGCSPESQRLLAARARVLVSLEARRKLARDWGHLVEVSRTPFVGMNFRAPICHDRVLDAQSDIQAMLVALRLELPIPVRGVAMASLLLTDGAGPIHNSRSAVDLREAIRAATRHMDPSADLFS